MIKGLTGNQLKIIAVIAMTVDHVGAFLFPNVLWLRMVGRLAYPIFAYMIAEGCTHTRSICRYLGTVALFAALCQVVCLFFLRSLYQYILVTFTLSILLIWIYRETQRHQNAIWLLCAVLATFAVFFVTQMLPGMWKGTDFRVDYDFLGVMLPVVIWLGKDKRQKLLLMTVMLLLMGQDFGKVQMLALAALPLLALYNEQRGKWNMKYFFYFYFPVHLVAIFGIGLLIK